MGSDNMVITKTVTLERGVRGFGFTMIYHESDEFNNDTGLFVTRIIPGSDAARFGVQPNDKILSINGQIPKNLDDTVKMIKETPKAIELIIQRTQEIEGKDESGPQKVDNF